MLISLKNLTKRYRNLLALEGITLEVEEGTIGLLGPNGAGKSTLIKTMLGLLNFQEGAGKIMDWDIQRENQFIRQNVGYMPENDAYFPHMDGVQLVSYCGRLGGLSSRDSLSRAHEVLDYLGMGEERYRLVETYSTGMKQKIKLAQAIVHDPKMVFLDEPTNGLDPAGREEMLTLARDLWERAGISVILSSHVLPDVERVCKNVIILVDGKVRAVDSLKNLKTLQDEAYRIQIKGDLEGFIEVLKKKKLRVDRISSQEIQIYQKDMTSTLDFFKLAKAQNVQVRKFQKLENTLEEIFLKTVGA